MQLCLCFLAGCGWILKFHIREKLLSACGRGGLGVRGFFGVTLSPRWKVYPNRKFVSAQDDPNCPWQSITLSFTLGGTKNGRVRLLSIKLATMFSSSNEKVCHPANLVTVNKMEIEAHVAHFWKDYVSCGLFFEKLSIQQARQLRQV